ncbi:hypothetical protein [Streptomyces otsuchiensis]|uniref:hypothetical protein n=1 Tax=Streptomyces otsuchiensis TaxID=2681388 RepID=UPI00102FE871|nr:hypothetical protein [Streptomyces otsuchiensis]
MNTSEIGLLSGMALGFAAYFGGFVAFLLVTAMGTIGLVVGRLAEGDMEFRRLLRPEGRERR